MAWSDQDHVDTDILALGSEFRGKYFCCCGDPLQSVFVDSVIEFVRRCAGFDLDKHHQVSAARDDVDFAAWGPFASGEDTIALAPQIPGGSRFSASTAPFGILTLHSGVLSAMARS